MRPTATGSTRSRLRAGAIGAFATAMIALLASPLAATPASASTSGILLSSDGVHYASTFSGTLFDSAALMVPMSTQSRSFWVKNASAEPAYLRVSVGDVTGGGNAFSAALSVEATTPSNPGAPVGVDTAAPCRVMTQGQYLTPGGVVRVDATLALGDLNGTAGQHSNVGFDILVGLSSAATGSMPATACLANSGTVPGAPSGGGGGGGTPGGAGGRGTPSGGTPEPDASGDVVGVVDLPDTPDGSAFAGRDAALGILNTNTGRFFQEWFVLVWALAAVAGGALQLLVARRRAYEGEEVMAWQVDGQTSGRKAWSTTSVSV